MITGSTMIEIAKNIYDCNLKQAILRFGIVFLVFWHGFLALSNK
jgi:hypothetical protein